VERLWPASTGWLIVSILFARQLWTIDLAQCQRAGLWLVCELF
jgi:hypothetical protein